MDFSKLFDKLPSDLVDASAVNELKLLKLFAYNAYFNGDVINIGDVNEGTTYDRTTKNNIDGVYLNEQLDDENVTIELVYSYWVGKQVFDLIKVYNAIQYISDVLNNVKKGIFVSNNKDAENLLAEYLKDYETKSVLIRVVTDYVPTEEEKYEINKKISSYNLSVSGIDLAKNITFGDEVVELVESNVAPFDYVEKDKLIVDEAQNILKFADHSFVCNVSARSLKELWHREGRRGLLAMNLRYYIPKKNIDEKLTESIIFKHDDFWYLNNGIIIVCDNYALVNNELRLEHFSIVNGGQTTRMIGETPFNGDFYVCCKVIKNTFENANEKNQFVANVAEATNSQKAISAKDIIANRIEQRNLKSLFQENGVFIEIKRGDKYNKEMYPEAWQRVKNNELAQALYSFVYMEPGPAHNSVSSILQSEEKYNKIFVNHEYSFPFLKSILFLMKSYKEYANMIKKDKTIGSTKQGLVRTGSQYVMATIGYLLKMLYNSEFVLMIQKYQSSDALNELYSSELAFNHAFISNKLSYKEYSKKIFALYDYLFDGLFVNEFELAKESSPSLATSNWVKSNTGFNSIRRRINREVLYSKNQYLLDYIQQYFVKIDQNQMNDNIDLYVSYVKKNKKILAKDSDNNALHEHDEALRNDLMIYRMNHANAKGIKETALFTDKMLDRLVYEKPINMIEIRKIISAKSAFYCGEDLIKIIAKYL